MCIFRPEISKIKKSHRKHLRSSSSEGARAIKHDDEIKSKYFLEKIVELNCDLLKDNTSVADASVPRYIIQFRYFSLIES